MCGICGIFNIESERPVEEEELVSMRDLMSHRGPDSDGSFFAANVGLGIRRLKVIDLATGDQPIYNEDKSIVVVLNGEIYNYREIRRRLEEKGHRFYTKSDTEIIVHLYEEEGPSFVRFLNGIFAIALWDNRNKSLFLARDHLGVKPLYYYYDGKRFIFASEIKAILAVKDIVPETDKISLDLYLTMGYVPGQRTMFLGIKRLPPGCMANLTKDRVGIERYWDIEFNPQLSLSEEEAVDILIEKIREAVSRQLVADVPVGAFLSGGVDSSLMVALMSSMANGAVKTYNVSFADSDGYSESKFAIMVSDIFKTQHRQIIMDPEVCKMLPELIWYQDEPLADQAIIPTYLVSKLSREDVTVVLTGEGGDELFAGYGHYDRRAVEWKMDLVSRLPQSFNKFLIDTYSRTPENTKGRLFFTRYAPHAKESFARRYLRTSQVAFTEPDKKLLYSHSMSDVCDTHNSDRQLKYYYENVSSWDPLSQMQYLDMKCYLADDLLVKTDKMSMAVSLEARVPYLDKDLVEFVSKLPPGIKLKKGIFKHILKKASANILPQDITVRPKHGFDVPVSEWLNGELKDFVATYLSRKSIEKEGLFNYAEVERMIKLHNTGRLDCSLRLWTLLVFELWKKIFIDKGLP